MSERKSDLIELGALWCSERTEGVMTGKIGNARLVLLPNKHKQPGEKSPDYRLFVAPKEDTQKRQPSSDDLDDDVPL